jgi:GT2 family glycosyltransferase
MKDWLASSSDIVSISAPPESTGLASNWNLGIAAALNDECSHVLISNNDVLFHPRTIDVLVDRPGDLERCSVLNQY